jgi:hypothetical protein
MTTRTWMLGTSLWFVAGCAGSKPPAVANAPSPASARAEATAPRAPSSEVQAAGARGRREKALPNELASAEFDERFAVTRQVTALERAIELYRAFIERAGDDPRYAEAVQRSRGRIEDARMTICFLLEKPCGESD